eukprot:734905-Prymnesium_polylepis.1
MSGCVVERSQRERVFLRSGSAWLRPLSDLLYLFSSVKAASGGLQSVVVARPPSRFACERGGGPKLH